MAISTGDTVVETENLDKSRQTLDAAENPPARALNPPHRIGNPKEKDLLQEKEQEEDEVEEQDDEEEDEEDEDKDEEKDEDEDEEEEEEEDAEDETLTEMVKAMGKKPPRNVSTKSATTGSTSRKRKRREPEDVESNSEIEPEDCPNPLFYTVGSEMRWKIYGARKCIPEKLVDHSSFSRFNMLAFLEKTGMMPTVTYAAPYVDSVVKLFYANITLKFGDITSKQYGKAYVRGSVYNVTPEIINSKLGMEGLTGMAEHVSDMKKVGLKLSGGRVSEWTPEMKVSSLTSLHNVLHKLTTTNWLPTSNSSTVTKDQAILIYKLSSGIKVDVGKMIFEKIWQEAETKKDTNLPYPSLIYQILCSQGFQPSDDDYPSKLPLSFKITNNQMKGDKCIDLPWLDPEQPPSEDNVDVEESHAALPNISVPHNFLLQELDRWNAQIKFFTEQLQRANEYKASINRILNCGKEGGTKDGHRDGYERDDEEDG